MPKTNRFVCVARVLLAARRQQQAQRAAPPKAAASQHVPGGGDDGSLNAATTFLGDCPLSTTASCSSSSQPAVCNTCRSPSMVSRYVFPVSAGVLAAIGGAITKCAVDAGQRGCLPKFGVAPEVCPAAATALGIPCDLFVVAVRVVWGVLMLATNGFMLELFVKSLHTVGSLPTTVIHLVANFSCTALIGAAAFGEQLPAHYAFGVSIMVGGVYLVQHGTDSHVQDAQLRHHPQQQRESVLSKNKVD